MGSRMALVFALMLLPIALTACAGAPTPAPVAGSDPGALPLELQRLVVLVNEARAESRVCGSEAFVAAAPLVLDARLTAAAQGHSDDMHANGFMSHTGSDGSSLPERVERQGYDWRGVAENVARGHGSAASVMAAWLTSPGHCANVMQPSFSALGVGLSGVSWTQVFAQPQ